MKKKILTIAIPIYNRKALLKECLEHIIPQVQKHIGVIICDNGSDDSTKELMETYYKEYSFMRYIKNKKILHRWKF